MRAPRAEPRLSDRPAARAAALVALCLPLLDRAALAAVLERVRADLWLTDLQLGLAASLPTLLAALLSFRRRPRRGSPLAGGLLWGAAAVLAGTARGAGTLFLARLVAGGASGVRAPATAAAAGARPAPREGALVVVAVALAALGYAGAGALGWRFGWRAALAAAATASLVLSLATARLGAFRQEGRLPPAAASEGGARASRAAPRGVFRRALAGGVLVAFAAGALVAWAPALLERARGVPRALAPYEVAAAVLMAGVAAAWASGAASGGRRRAARPQWICAGSALLAAPLGLAALLARQPGVYLGALIMALALTLVALATLRESLALAPTAHRGGAAAAEALPWVALLGDAPAALLVGALSNATSLWWAMLAVPAALLAGGALLAHAAWRADA